MSPARRGAEGSGGRGRARGASAKKQPARAAAEATTRGRSSRAEREPERPAARGSKRARSSRQVAGGRRPEVKRGAVAVRVEREPPRLPPTGFDLLEDAISDLLAPWEPPWKPWTGFAPPIDVRESEDVYEVVCELPGVDASDVEVSTQGDLLRIEGEKRWRTEREDEFVHAFERGQGRFVRAFRLPFAAESDRIEATLQDGLLRVRVPKPPGRGTREVPVRAAPRPA